MGTHRSYRRAGGFTLLEILVVVALIVLIAAIGGGYYVGTYKMLVVEKSAKDLFGAAKYARLIAVERRGGCKLLFSEAQNSYGLFCYAENKETGRVQEVAVRDSYFKGVTLPEGVKFEVIKIDESGIARKNDSEEEKAVEFSPTGTAQWAVIQIGDGKSHYTVSISATTGKVKMLAGTVADVKFATIDLDEQGESVAGI